ncbi:MAG: hypothetical protein OS130_04205 [Thermodesulfobacteriota bacterium]|jgi:hypothetical protein|nr:MAG: hypothetical protein OS130_04205 [Thermodesulfobacteriota bacterium]
MNIRSLQYGITICALLVALAHIIWPSLTIDAITVTLIFIALVPWLAPLFKSLELPGRLKIEFQDFERARTKADKAGLLSEFPRIESERQYSFQLVAQEDPKLALAGLRIEIEKRLTEIAESNNINPEKAGIGRLLRILGERQLLSQEQRSALADMVGLLNSAVHGGEIDNRAAEWALDVGPRLVSALEAKVNKI